MSGIATGSARNRMVVTLGGTADSLASQRSAAADAPAQNASQVCIRVVPPPACTFTDTDDGSLRELEERLVDLVHAVQQARETLVVSGQGSGIVVLLPADVTLGTPENALAGSLCGAALSFARTAAIELRKDGISMNVVLHGELPDEDLGAMTKLLDSLLDSGTLITGQEIYVDRGPNLGRVKP
ncbi:hypothetical protein [Sciscionella sediminilitoris]|uniref:hypothetical protein n=1 Tax=Sciscionella sediminilitoris TaxID=1445613 RepID=UPI0007C6708D|nr:hypothetical protein [Sciscionella sp. SE31]